MSARIVVLIFAAAVLAACSHHAPPAVTPTPAASQQAAKPTAAPPAPAPVAKPATDNTVDQTATVRAALTQMTLFDFNKADLTAQDQTELAAKATILNANPAVAIQIAGNCDDRGSDEYNLALGQRRAAMAKRYLTEHGVAESRISTVSYGKEHPVATGDNETAWAQNRNDQFQITTGADHLKAPSA